jgi:hypothetical protein
MAKPRMQIWNNPKNENSDLGLFVSSCLFLESADMSQKFHHSRSISVSSILEMMNIDVD